MAKRPPRKPSEPLAKIIFPAGDRGVHVVVEPLPDVKEDLELAIVSKFIGALRAEGIRLEPPARGSDEWPDFETRTEAGTAIGIEVVEVIDHDQAQKRARQLQYLAELLPRIQDLESNLDGVVVTLVDGYQTPQWPAVRSAEGRRLLSHIVERLRAEIDAVANVPPGPGLYRRWDFEGMQVGIMAIRGRRLSGSRSTGIDVSFFGTFPTDSLVLARSIGGKVRKAYGGYGGGELWLLAYAHFYPAIADDAVSGARLLLKATHHPFSEAWAFFPLSDEKAGVAVKVFP